MVAVARFRTIGLRAMTATLLAVAVPIQWQAFCEGWQSPQHAMACCHRANHDDDAGAAFGCCDSQEQSQHAQAPGVAVLSHDPVGLSERVPVLALARRHAESTRRAGTIDSRLLGSVFLI